MGPRRSVHCWGACGMSSGLGCSRGCRHQGAVLRVSRASKVLRSFGISLRARLGASAATSSSLRAVRVAPRSWASFALFTILTRAASASSKVVDAASRGVAILTLRCCLSSPWPARWRSMAILWTLTSRAGLWVTPLILVAALEFSDGGVAGDRRGHMGCVGCGWVKPRTQDLVGLGCD